MQTLTDVQISRISADIGRGGWEIRGTAYNDADMISENERLQIFVRAKMEGDWDPAWIQRFVGYCLPQNIKRYHDQSRMEFIAHTSDAYLRRGRVQGIYFTEEAAPANEHQITNMNSGKIIDHIIDDHTNMGPNTPAPNGWVDITDIDETNSADLTVLSLHEGIIWERIKQLAENEFYVAYFSKDDHFHYIPHPTFDAVLPAVTMIWDDDFICEPIEIIPRTSKRYNQAVLRALQDGGAILTSVYPAQPAIAEPEVYGEKLRLTRLRCNSQALLNTWAERRYQWENRDYTIRIKRPGLVGCWFELLDRIQITYSSVADGIDWNLKDFWIHKISCSYDNKTRTGQTVFTLEEGADTSL